MNYNIITEYEKACTCGIKGNHDFPLSRKSSLGMAVSLPSRVAM